MYYERLKLLLEKIYCYQVLEAGQPHSSFFSFFSPEYSLIEWNIGYKRGPACIMAFGVKSSNM